MWPRGLSIIIREGTGPTQTSLDATCTFLTCLRKFSFVIWYYVCITNWICLGLAFWALKKSVNQVKVSNIQQCLDVL